MLCLFLPESFEASASDPPVQMAGAGKGMLAPTWHWACAIVTGKTKVHPKLLQTVRSRAMPLTLWASFSAASEML